MSTAAVLDTKQEKTDQTRAQRWNQGGAQPLNDQTREKHPVNQQARREKRSRNHRHTLPACSFQPDAPEPQESLIQNAYQRNQPTHVPATMQVCNMDNVNVTCPVRRAIFLGCRYSQQPPLFKQATCWLRHRCAGSGHHPRRSDLRDQSRGRRTGQWYPRGCKMHRWRRWWRGRRGQHR